jgi:hypothetical protein
LYPSGRCCPGYGFGGGHGLAEHRSAPRHGCVILY